MYVRAFECVCGHGSEKGSHLSDDVPVTECLTNYSSWVMKFRECSALDKYENCRCVLIHNDAANECMSQ